LNYMARIAFFFGLIVEDADCLLFILKQI